MSSKVNVTEYYNELCISYREKYKEKEIWKPVVIDDITSRYMISNYGRIFDIDKIKIPTIYFLNKHYWVTIKLDNGKRMNMGVYRIVALMFIDVPEKYFELGYTKKDLFVDHIRDGEPDNFDDNTIWNLQWLTCRENTSKAAKCGIRSAFPNGFKEELDKMILDDCSNAEIYETLFDKYGYTKEELKADVQVRRRRLGKTLKEHHENDKEFVDKIDSLLKEGLSNDEIIEKLNMPDDGRASRRLLQYRRSLLKIPATSSKYLSNEDNELLKQMIMDGKKTKEIVKFFKLDNLPDNERKKFEATVGARRHLYKKQGLIKQK